VVLLASLKYVVSVLTGRKRSKEAPMKQAFIDGIRSVSETLWTIGTSYAVVALPA